eukprot:c8095_g1_i1 orf=170-964(-)
MELGGHEVAEIQIPIQGKFSSIHEGSKMRIMGASGNAMNGDSNGPPLEEARQPAEVKLKKAVRYKECLKNHAANLGGYATDGCGEFMPNGADGTLEALKCAACYCHRNFHRREDDGESACQCGHAYYKDRKRPGTLLPRPYIPLGLPSATMLGRPPQLMAVNNAPSEYADEDAGLSSPTCMFMKKRFRTKFTAEQKDKMLAFAEKLGWRIQKHDEPAVQQFCMESGVKRHVLKVWMHNNKNTRSLPVKMESESTLRVPQLENSQ